MPRCDRRRGGERDNKGVSGEHPQGYREPLHHLWLPVPPTSRQRGIRHHGLWRRGTLQVVTLRLPRHYVSLYTTCCDVLVFSTSLGTVATFYFYILDRKGCKHDLWVWIFLGKGIVASFLSKRGPWLFSTLWPLCSRINLFSLSCHQFLDFSVTYFGYSKVVIWF